MTKIPNSHLMTTVELANVLDAEFRKYNARRHRGTKAIPLETLRAHPTEPRRVDEKHIALALLRRTKGTIQKDGVEFNGIMYQGPGTFAHIDEEIIRGSLVTRPDFLHVFDPNHGGDEVWLGRLTPAADAGVAMARAVYDARRYQIETVERAQRLADDLCKEMLVQLRGGIVEEPGADPVEHRPSRRRGTKKEDDSLKKRQARNADSPIWKK